MISESLRQKKEDTGGGKGKKYGTEGESEKFWGLSGVSVKPRKISWVQHLVNKGRVEFTPEAKKK
jgi:hypothetical protein